MIMDAERPSPKLIASTGHTYCCNIQETAPRESSLKSHVPPTEDWETTITPEPGNEETQSNYFKSAQWSPDGTCLLTSSADHTLRTFVLPPDLLTPRPTPHKLTPFHQQHFPEPISTLTPYPLFNLSTPETALVLTSHRDHPITLHSALYASEKPLASYLLINPTTEAYLTPSSLIFNHDGHSFLTGTDCLIAFFDISRNGDGPVTRLPTIPSKRHKLKGGGVGMRGMVSTLALQNLTGSPSGPSATALLAAGTWTRWIGLYDAAGAGGTVANFSVANQAGHSDSGDAMSSTPDIGGRGISQVLWSPCGRYLLVAERKSRGVLVYDVRVTGRLLGWLAGREADTNQRLGVDVCVDDGGDEGGFEVWAGGNDGVVRVWEGVGRIEGRQDVGWEWNVGSDSITSTVIHPSRTVVATSSGQRKSVECDDLSASETDSNSVSDSDSENESIRRTPVPVDNSIKVWNLT